MTKTRTRKTTKPAIPTTQNEGWGFWGTMTMGGCAQGANPATVAGRTAHAWDAAMMTIANTTGCSLEAVRAFLDSRWGRHFADEVNDRVHYGTRLPAAIAETTAKWMSWKIGGRTAAEYGIPKGLPYLTGWVEHAAIAAAAAEQEQG